MIHQLAEGADALPKDGSKPTAPPTNAFEGFGSFA